MSTNTVTSFGLCSVHSRVFSAGLPVHFVEFSGITHEDAPQSIEIADNSGSGDGFGVSFPGSVPPPLSVCS